jgi:squalene-hopene/tetraprenyl-beta-curcumene cyclase
MLEKEVKSFGDWSVKNPVKEPSGWYFQHANEFYPDNDDAAVVMMSLQLLDLPDKDRKSRQSSGVSSGLWGCSVMMEGGGLLIKIIIRKF